VPPAAIEVVQLGGGEVDRLGMTHGIVFSRRRLLGHGQERRICHTCPAVADGGGESVETTGSGIAIGGERKVERPEKSVLCRRGDLGSTDIAFVGELSRSATRLAERIDRTQGLGSPVLECGVQHWSSKWDARRCRQLSVWCVVRQAWQLRRLVDSSIGDIRR
jgi:hypothetical protein